MTDQASRVRSIVEPLVTQVGLVLFDLELSSGKLVVTVDAAEGGADIDAIASATRAISRALDEEDPIAGKYVLEVTSPGLERPLRSPEHFRWAVDSEVTVRLKGEAAREGSRRFNGTLRSANGTGITILDENGEEVSIDYADIERARTVFDFEAELRAAKHDNAGRSGPARGRRAPDQADAAEERR